MASNVLVIGIATTIAVEKFINKLTNNNIIQAIRELDIHIAI